MARGHGLIRAVVTGPQFIITGQIRRELDLTDRQQEVTRLGNFFRKGVDVEIYDLAGRFRVTGPAPKSNSGWHLLFISRL